MRSSGPDPLESGPGFAKVDTIVCGTRPFSDVADDAAACCEIHHIHSWKAGGDTALHNCVQLCRIHHRLLHHSEWTVRIHDGLPEFIPPAWIDPTREPRRKPLPHLTPAA